jgi:hypothetical protein
MFKNKKQLDKYLQSKGIRNNLMITVMGIDGLHIIFLHKKGFLHEIVICSSGLKYIPQEDIDEMIDLAAFNGDIYAETRWKDDQTPSDG